MTVFFIIIFVLAFIIGILKAFLEDSNKKKSVTTTSSFKNKKSDDKFETDLVEMSEHSPTCAECAKYQGRVYSISGKSKKFPKLPDQIAKNGCVHEGCRHRLYPYFDGYSTPNYHENIVEYSNSPFVDNRSPEEIAEYEKNIKEAADRKRDFDEYELIKQKLPDYAPKSLSGYRRMKNLKSKNYQLLKEKCANSGITINEESEQKSNELEVVENNVIDALSSENETVSDLATIETPIGWEIAVSFGKSTSSNFDRALYLAKNAKRYEETEYNGKKIYQAFFSSEPKSYLDFIKLYELVSGWKSTNVTINGEIVDRKIVSGLNWCYGDRCRTGKTNFCYGASEMTDNPFGCHRLQISRCNHPWWRFTNYNGVNYTVDKKAILERATDYSTAYRLCPAFNWEKIVHTIEELPDTIDSIESYELDGSFSINLIE